jgi:tetratricopeptide (TPR) repeat protein
VQAVCAASAVQREKAKTLLTQSAALLDEQTEPGERAFALLLLGITAYRLQIYLVASEYLEACLRSCQVEDWWVQANAYYYLGFIDNKRGAFASAWPKLQTGLAFQRQLNNPSELAAILSLLGYVGAYLHKPQAVDYLHESLDIQRATNNKRGIAQALDYLGTAMAHRGEYTQAERILSIIRGRQTPAEGTCRKCQIQVHCATYAR